MLFDWLYPAHFPTVLACLEAWAGGALSAPQPGLLQHALSASALFLCADARPCIAARGISLRACPCRLRHAAGPTAYGLGPRSRRERARQTALLADMPEVTTALLKFMAEFVLNKTQRLTFDSSSPNGILLFREVSKARGPPRRWQPPALAARLARGPQGAVMASTDRMRSW